MAGEPATDSGGLNSAAGTGAPSGSRHRFGSPTLPTAGVTGTRIR